MTEVELKKEHDISGYYLVEGLPGTGLVAKIASDYLIDIFDMELYATIQDENIDRVAVFDEGDPELKLPVRIYVDQEKELAVLKSDAPLPADLTGFMEKITAFIDKNNLQPVLLTGLPIDVKEGEHGFFQVKRGDWKNISVDKPPVDGGIGGATGALLNELIRKDLETFCLVIESNPRFPDPEASRILLEDGVEPLTEVEIDTQKLEESIDRIKKKKKEMAEKLQDQKEKSSEAFPREMYK